MRRLSHGTGLKIFGIGRRTRLWRAECGRFGLVRTRCPSFPRAAVGGRCPAAAVLGVKRRGTGCGGKKRATGRRVRTGAAPGMLCLNPQPERGRG